MQMFILRIVSGFLMKLKSWHGALTGLVVFFILFLPILYLTITEGYAFIDLENLIIFSVLLLIFPVPGILIPIVLCITGFKIAKGRSLFSVISLLVLASGALLFASGILCFAIGEALEIGEGGMICLAPGIYAIPVLILGGLLLVIKTIIKK